MDIFDGTVISCWLDGLDNQCYELVRHNPHSDNLR